ncbi:hepcidin-like [Toxotes jaculatrix]|uniref:hepcidin-like n=1 Tax=Toxotes jaculatrix TaxID=941984 RepID=UPI001B3AA613|nr:hepcidin-like [Toxotes jaculatrix]
MKTFSVAVAVVMLAFIYIQESSAFPFTGVQEPEETVSNDNPDAAEEETSVETWMMPYNIRQRNYTGPIRCRYCCGCCVLDVCGMCCK